MGTIRQIRKYLRWRLRAKGRFSVHSPSLFALYQAIRNRCTQYSGWETAEQIRQKMLHDHQIIMVRDLGAGKRNGARPVHKIATSSSHKPKYYRMLSKLAAYGKPGCILEIGTSLGIGTLYLHASCPEAHIITIEGCHETANTAALNFNTAGFRPEMLRGGFDEHLPVILRRSDFSADFVWIDGNHTKEATLNYFSQCLSKAHQKSVFVFDDIYWSEGMEEAWYVIRNHPSVRVSIDLFDCGIILFDERLSPGHFVLRY